MRRDGTRRVGEGRTALPDMLRDAARERRPIDRRIPVCRPVTDGTALPDRAEPPATMSGSAVRVHVRADYIAIPLYAGMGMVSGVERRDFTGDTPEALNPKGNRKRHSGAEPESLRPPEIHPGYPSPPPPCIGILSALAGFQRFPHPYAAVRLGRAYPWPGRP